MNRIRAAARTIASARRHRTPLPPLDAEVAPRDEAEGYLIQAALADLLSPDFGAQVGYKIGCTSAVMQHYLGIPHPCGGGVFANGVHPSGVSLPAMKKMYFQEPVSFGELLAQWRRALEHLAIDFRTGHAEVDPKPDACEYCGLRALCRIREYENDRG